MSDAAWARLSAERRALLAARLRAEGGLARTGEPIAVVGMACRFPGGADGPDAFWERLCAGFDAVGEVPADRWDAAAYYDPDPDAPGKMSSRWGAFLDGVDRFDAGFFAIGAAEAASMDPQQRLLLEVAWEAIEHAGVPPRALRGGDVGVFVGLSGSDYGRLCGADPARIDMYTGMGSAGNLAAGRLAHAFDLRGPCVVVDTACSSALAAVHLACQSLRSDECGLALAGGVNLILAPENSIYMSTTRMFAADGRCKPFDARADGFVRGEGCGVVALRRLYDAIADGDRVHAVILGSAMNQDGRSAGLTAPNPAAQRAVVGAALRRAGVTPDEVGLVETHGTGTALGDPIEVEALAEVFGGPRPDGRGCALGAVKSNLGHLEAAAGIAGFIKTVLAIERGRIPANLHFNNCNPHIDLARTPFHVPTRAATWPEGQPRCAGVSAFGWSGTNVHVVLGEAPAGLDDGAVVEGPVLLPLSARSPAALVELARRWVVRLRGPGSLAALAATACLRRTHHAHRFVAVGDAGGLIEQLEAFVGGERTASVARVPGPRVVFVFPGQGSQWAGMARDLLVDEPVFRAAVAACDAAMAGEPNGSVLARLREEASDWLGDIGVVQPVLFAVQVGLAALWRDRGVEPDAVIGHSMGELAAACVAGALSLEDAARVICRRSALLRRIRGQGAMLSVGLAQVDAEAAIAGRTHAVAVAVANSPQATVLAGDPVALADLAGELTARGVFCRAIQVEVASHSPQVDPLLPALRAALVDVAPRAASVPFYSCVTGELLAGESLNAEYWLRNLRAPVRFADTLARVLAAGPAVLLELSPHPLLVVPTLQTVQALGRDDRAIASLQREQPARGSLLAALGELHALGVAVRLERVCDLDAGVASLPAYPWQRARHWLDTRDTAGGGAGPVEHPLLGRRLAAPGRAAMFAGTLSATAPRFLADHRLHGRAVVPAALWLAAGRAAAASVLGAGPWELLEVELPEALVLADDGGAAVQVWLTPGDDGAELAVSSQAGDGWRCHARGRVRRAQAGVPAEVAAGPEDRSWGDSPGPEDMSPVPEDRSHGGATHGPEDRFSEDPPGALAAVAGRLGAGIDGDAVYRRFAALGFGFGPAFRGISRLWLGDGEALARVALPAGTAPAGDGPHPALLDAALQVLGAGALGADGGDGTFVPIALERVVLADDVGATRWVHARFGAGAGAATRRGALALFDAAGRRVAAIDGLVATRVEAAALQPRGELLREALWQESWQAAPPLARAGDASTWQIVGDRGGFGEALATALVARGARARVVAIAAIDPGEPVVFLGGLDTPGPERLSEGTWPEVLAPGCLALLQVLRAGPSRVWIATRGARAVEATGPAGPLQALLWGLGRSAALERPELALGLCDLDPDNASAEPLADLLLGGEPDEWALRGDRRFVQRVVRATAPAPRRLVCDPAGVYVIAGGLGGLGRTIAGWLVERGARRLVLCSRGAPGADATAAIAGWRAAGVVVAVAAVDVADASALARVLAAARVGGPIRGVVHAAGALADGLLAQQDETSFTRVAAARLAGTWNLHVLTAGDPLAWFIACSSVAALTGAAGQGNYAAAAAGLDALMEWRRAGGRPALTIQWGAWADVGLAAGGSRDAAWWAARGVRTIAPADGLAALERLLAGERGRVAVFPVDASRFAAQFAGPPPPALAGLARAGATVTASGLRAAVLAAPAERRAATVLMHVRALVADMLRTTDEPPPVDVGLVQLGFDSLMALDLRRRLQAGVGQALPATLAFDHPTIAALAGYLGRAVFGLIEAPPTPVVASDDAAVTRVAAMSEAEIDREIQDRLAALLGEE